MVPWPCFVWWKEWVELVIFVLPGGWEVAGEWVGGGNYVRENCQGEHVPFLFVDQQDMGRARPPREPPWGMERSRTPCIEHSLPWNNFPLFEELQSDTSVPPKSSASVLLTLLFMDQVLASRIQLREAWRCQEQNTTPKACSPFADDWKQHLQDLLKSSIKLCSSVSCRPA